MTGMQVNPVTDPPPGTCEDCGEQTPMKGVARCLMCRIKREKAAMADQRPVPQAISEWSGKRYPQPDNSA